MSGIEVIERDDLPASNFSREFIGADHGGTGVSFILVEAEPGRGPSLHKHDYDEIFIVLEGQATVFTGDEEMEIRGGQVVIVRAGQPHGFTNTGDGPLRQIDIHLSDRFGTEWLEQAAD